MSEWGSEEYSTDENKRKRSEESPNIFKKSKKLSRTPPATNKKEMEEIKEMITEMLQEMKEIRKENKGLRELLQTYKKENDETKQEVKLLKEKVQKLERMEDKFEKNDKKNRKNNVIISGSQIKETSDRVSTTNMENFLSQHMQVTAKVIEVKKIGNNLYIIEMEKFDKKIEILRNKYKLKNGTQNRVFINSDLTEKERNIQKTLRELADKMKKENKRVQVKYQQLIIDGEKWNWNNTKQKLEIGKNNEEHDSKNGKE